MGGTRDNRDSYKAEGKNGFEWQIDRKLENGRERETRTEREMWVRPEQRRIPPTIYPIIGICHILKVME
jgi:hypothetical protein